MSKHTPGPWEFSSDKGSTRDIIESRGKPMMCMVRLSWVSPEEYHANARLIASAPELLEALKAEESHQQALRNFQSISDPLDDRLLGMKNEVDRTRSIANMLRREVIAKAEAL